jgi:hypothetical protein
MVCPPCRWRSICLDVSCCFHWSLWSQVRVPRPGGRQPREVYWPRLRRRLTHLRLQRWPLQPTQPPLCHPPRLQRRGPRPPPAPADRPRCHRRLYLPRLRRRSHPQRVSWEGLIFPFMGSVLRLILSWAARYLQIRCRVRPVTPSFPLRPIAGAAQWGA